MLGLIISMEEGEKLSLEQIRAFLEANGEVCFQAHSRGELYGWFHQSGLRSVETGGQRTGAALLGQHDRIEPGASNSADRALPTKR